MIYVDKQLLQRRIRTLVGQPCGLIEISDLAQARVSPNGCGSYTVFTRPDTLAHSFTLCPWGGWRRGSVGRSIRSWDVPRHVRIAVGRALAADPEYRLQRRTARWAKMKDR